MSLIYFASEHYNTLTIVPAGVNTMLETTETADLMEKALFIGEIEESMLDISKMVSDTGKAFNTSGMNKLKSKRIGQIVIVCGF